MGDFDEAIQAFEKMQTIVPSNPEVMYQLASIYELYGNIKQAIKWYSILITRVPSDPAVLQKIGSLYYKEKDEIQALHFFQESYRYYPSNIETLSWLGVYYAQNDLYEKAIQFFERASMIQPNEVKWKLMVATCYRKMSAYQQALKLYQEINSQHPENLDCLRYLVMICKDLGISYEAYNMQLKKLERAQETRAVPQAYDELPSSMEPGFSVPPALPTSMEMPAPPAKKARMVVPKAEEEDNFLDDVAPDLLPQFSQ
eukprot:TRINITY_DN777_c0_g2_i2.p2 TRINITY_DN777_c0_g2~~TRINITY_DN777_c0_g2_i2.p2  ORF type:complete len:257 (+),score=45.73 TRINITY_DN777_c0_g2_i2:251-1021(+)